MASWCLIVVPGVNRQPVNWLRNLVASQLIEAEGSALTSSDPEAAEKAVYTLAPEPGSDNHAFSRLDIVEAYWTDLIPNDGETKPWVRLLSGISLVAYWVTDAKLWRAVFSSSWFIILGYGFAGLLLVVWLMTLLVTVAPVIIDIAEKNNVATLPPIMWIADAIKHPQSSVWMVSAQMFTIFLPLTPFVTVIDLARLGRSYLTNHRLSSGDSLQASIRKRIETRLKSATAGDYDRVVVLGHSFGTLPVVDLLADWREHDFANLKVITLGSPAGVFSVKSRWLGSEVERAVGRNPAFGWVDFVLRRDFWCSGLLPQTGAPAPGRFERRVLDNSRGFWAGVKGDVHMDYFTQPDVLAELVR